MALNDKSQLRITALFEARLPDRMKALAEEKCRMLRKAAVHGAGNSSYATKSLYQLCAQELDILVALAWQDVKRVVISLQMQPSHALAGDLKKRVRALLSPPYAEINKLYEHWISVQRDKPRSLEPAIENAYDKIDPEIDLFADTLAVASNRPDGLSSIIVQGNAQVGAIVASPGASAQVTQQNISDNRQLILEALDRVLTAISGSSHYSELSEARKMVEDARTELGKDKPNSLKLSTAITGIGTAINMLAGLKPAYESLKSAAAVLGVSLP